MGFVLQIVAWITISITPVAGGGLWMLEVAASSWQCPFRWPDKHSEVRLPPQLALLSPKEGQAHQRPRWLAPREDPGPGLRSPQGRQVARMDHLFPSPAQPCFSAGSPIQGASVAAAEEGCLAPVPPPALPP